MKKHKRELRKEALVKLANPWEKFFQTKTYKINKNESSKENNSRKNRN